MRTDRKYLTLKKCLLGLAVLVYLTGIFQQELFEVTHILAHQFDGGYTYHSHHADGNISDHEHQMLDIAKTAFEPPKDAPVSQENRPKLSFDKMLPIYLPIALQTHLGGLKKKKIPLFNLQLPATPFLQLSTPPPDFHS